jgi:hypothetical protein
LPRRGLIIGQAGDPSRSPPLAERPDRPGVNSMETNPMDSNYVLKPAEEAAEEATRAVQIALDRRDNGGAASK